MERRTVTITLQVEVDGDDVRGSAHGVTLDPVAAAPSGSAHGVAPAAAPSGSAHGVAPAAAPRVFAGWLGLIGAIDALLGFPPDNGAAARALANREGAPR